VPLAKADRSVVAHFARFPQPKRYQYWVGHHERRLRCECGHVFTPDGRQLSGNGLVSCRGDRGKPCGRHLLIIVIRGYDKKLVARVSAKDLDVMQERRLEPIAELAYLLNEPVIPDDEER
jgi:hypothetical protein